MMQVNRYLMALVILFLTMVAVIVFWLLGGQNAVVTITAVVGLILTILRWFFPLQPDQYNPPDDNQRNLSFGTRRSSSSKRFSGGTFRKR